jgi:hypothetical protein
MSAVAILPFVVTVAYIAGSMKPLAGLAGRRPLNPRRSMPQEVLTYIAIGDVSDLTV